VITSEKVTAIQLRDGWHDVTEFDFYGDPACKDVSQSGASWTEQGCRYTCLRSAVLAVREGNPPSEPEEPEVDARAMREMNNRQKAEEFILQTLRQTDGLMCLNELLEKAKWACLGTNATRQAVANLHKVGAVTMRLGPRGPRGGVLELAPAQAQPAEGPRSKFQYGSKEQS